MTQLGRNPGQVMQKMQSAMDPRMLQQMGGAQGMMKKSWSSDAEDAERYGSSDVAADGRRAGHDEDDEGVWQDGGRYGRPWRNGPIAAPEYAEDDGQREEGWPEMRGAARSE